MGSSARRRAQHRRVMWAGIGVSAVIHGAALAWVAVPGGGAAATGSSARQGVIDDHAIQVVRLADDVSGETASAAGQVAAPAPAAEAAAQVAAFQAQPDLVGDLMASLEPANITGGTPRLGTPVAFSDLEPLTPMHAGSPTPDQGGVNGSEDERRGGGWGAIFGGTRVTIQGGGACAVPVGGTVAARRPGIRLADPFGRIR